MEIYHNNRCRKSRETLQLINDANVEVEIIEYLKTPLTEKDLVIIFDNGLTFEEHIASIVKKANSLTGMIHRSSVYLDKEMFKTLFTSFIIPHLEYGASIWNPHTKKQTTTIESVQRRASRLVPGLSHLCYQERLKALNLLHVFFIRKTFIRK